MQLTDEIYLYHYFERDFGPFMPLTALPYEKAREILVARRAAGKPGNPDIDRFLRRRYDADRRLYDAFVKHGGWPQKKNPVYMFFGEHHHFSMPMLADTPPASMQRRFWA